MHWFKLLTLQIALVGADTSPVIPRATIFSTADETIPICTEAVIELEGFVTSFTPGGTPDYGAAFDKAFNLFSNNATIGGLCACIIVRVCVHVSVHSQWSIV